MILQYTGTYRSLSPFISEDLTPLTIITGKNGSGKSQLVDLFKERKNNHHILFQITPNPRFIQIEQIEINSFQSINPQVWKDNILNVFAPANNFGQGIFYIIQKLNDKGVDVTGLTRNNIDEHLKSIDITEQNLNTVPNLNVTLPLRLGFETIKNFLCVNQKLIRKIKLVSSLVKKPIKDLEESDFLKANLDEQSIETRDLFTSQLEFVFYNFQKRRYKNRIDNAHKISYGEHNDSVSDEYFLTSYPSPFSIINALLSKYNSKYVFEEPLIKDFNEHQPEPVRLKNKITNAFVDPAHLSSGEKVIIGLIVKLFHTSYLKDSLGYPDLIVLDEPDANLHPEMSKLLIDVLHEVFVKQLGIQVIFTTHSPSSIAVAPDDCIFELKNEPSTSLKKISKDDALKILTENIPTLSIDYKNHRQVFVESPTDVIYYQNVFGVMKQEAKLLHNLYFVAADYGKGSSSQVIKVVNALREGGIKTVFGIIDSDNSNTSSSSILVHGHQKKYSVENFLYDPMYLFILFMEDRCANDIKDAGFTETYLPYNIFKEPQEKILNYLRWFFGKVNTKFKTLKYENTVSNEYGNAFVIPIPDWYFNMQGHELKDKLSQVFPSLQKAEYTETGKLETLMTNIICRSYPYIPKDTYEILVTLGVSS